VFCRKIGQMPEVHSHEEALEQYAMGKLSEADAEPLEEHLLFCQRCCERVAFLDNFVKSMRSAAGKLAQAAAVGHRS